MVKFTKKPFSRRRTGKFTKKTMRKPRTSFKRGAVRTVDPTVVRINPGKDPIIKIKKSLKEISPYAVGVLNQNGMYLAGQAAIIGNVALQMLFDPSGTFGSNSVTYVGGVLFTAPAAIPEWPSYSTLYDMYKVVKITAKFTSVDIANLDVGSPVIYVRYNSKYQAVAPTPSELSTQRGWIKKTFTDAQRDFTYSFYPKVMNYIDNGAALATDSRSPVSMPWTNVATPVEIYGLQCYAVLPNSPSAFSINCNYEYTILFKVAS